jgi:hypothetical protein
MNRKLLLFGLCILFISCTYAYPTDWCIALNQSGTVSLWCLINSTRNVTVTNNFTYYTNITNNITYNITNNITNNYTSENNFTLYFNASGVNPWLMDYNNISFNESYANQTIISWCSIYNDTSFITSNYNTTTTLISNFYPFSNPYNFLNTSPNSSLNLSGTLGFNNGSLSTWRLFGNGDNSGRFFHVASYKTGEDILTISESGNVGINKESNAITDKSWFNNSYGQYGLNDFHVWGNYTRDYPAVYRVVVINSTISGGMINVTVQKMILNSTFQYLINYTNITNLTNYAIEAGLYFNWTNTTNITQNSSWIFTAFPQLPQATLSVRNPQFEQVLFYNTSNDYYMDLTYQAGTGMNNQLMYNDTFAITNRSVLYLGRPVKFRSISYVLATPATGAI